ncbi:Hint domain-containing protein [Jannaschia sp. CCS1]|uniref:Hint domain-containing protein n=1 Tax=Jannaschia sp. (strain CCS1) TaxID=290400 RepID=UPI000053D7CA|nr:Hint domain-containing protein [Jannaschia sp. CCS1]ABD52927.1 hypothetical protein Jann_0010 [Jannaschia sp. CCS1]
MPVFLTLTNANILDPAFWAAQVVDGNSTINATAVSDTLQITLTGGSITITDTTTSVSTTFTNADLSGGAFSNVVQFRGNDADNIIGGSVGLNGQGYRGGSGDDQLTDDGNLGGQMRGGRGDDTIIGGTGDNQIRGNGGDDLLIGGSGNNNLIGGSGDDTLIGDQGSGNLIGGSGDDLIITSELTTFVDGGSGDNQMIIPENATFTPFSPGSTGGEVTVTFPDMSTRTFTYLNIAAENITTICFAAGTRIATPRGQVAVEDLRVGDRVVTRDGGIQALRWIGFRTVPADGPLAPIHITKGALGNTRALTVSPEHRMLVQGWRCQVLFGREEGLCAAKHLVDGDSIYRDPRELVTYFHVMFDAHQIILAEGTWAESLYIGDYQTAHDPELYAELFTLFPELEDTAHPARLLAAEPLRAFEATALRDA